MQPLTLLFVMPGKHKAYMLDNGWVSQSTAIEQLAVRRRANSSQPTAESLCNTKTYQKRTCVKKSV